MPGVPDLLTKDQHNKQAYPKNSSAWFSFHFKQQIHQTNLITYSKNNIIISNSGPPQHPPPTSEGRTWMRSSQSNSRRSSGGFASFELSAAAPASSGVSWHFAVMPWARNVFPKAHTTICMAKIRSWVLLNLLNRALWHRKQFFSEINFVRKQLPLFLSGPQRKINYITYTHIPGRVDFKPWSG